MAQFPDSDVAYGIWNLNQVRNAVRGGNWPVVPTGPDIVTDGLILSLDTAVSNSYPGTGTTWFDLSGNNYDATLTNGPTYSSDDSGKLVFDGVDYINGVHNATLDLTGSMTAEAWFRVTSNPGDWVRVIGKGSGSNRTFGLWYNVTATDFLYQRYGSSNMNAIYNATVTFNQWYHIVGTSNGSSHTLYLNGVSVGTSSTGSTFVSSTDPYTLGWMNLHTYHHGDIAVGRLYNRALTSTEVQQNFDETKARYGF